MKCAICETRKARRYCPGVRGEICPVCCGTERENTVDCPFDCMYLREARAREKPNELDPATVPNADIRLPERYLEDHPEAGDTVFNALATAIFSMPGVTDYDVRDALDALVRTYRTLQSGLVYETRPTNLIAANLYARVQERLKELREHVKSVRDPEVLAILVFLQRLEYVDNNGRKRGRAFIDSLRPYYQQKTSVLNPEAAPLIV